MRGSRRTRGLLLFSLFAAGLALFAIGAQAAALPRLLYVDGTTRFSVRPATITIGCCDPSILAGPHRTSADLRHGHLGHIQWTAWTQASAAGKGTMLIDDCTPDCARGKYRAYAASVAASRVRGRRFTRLKITFRQSRHRVVDRLTLHRVSRPVQYFWG